MLVVQEEAGLLEIGVVQQLLQRMHRPVGDVFPIEQVMPFGRRAQLQLLADDAV